MHTSPVEIRVNGATVVAEFRVDRDMGRVGLDMSVRYLTSKSAINSGVVGGPAGGRFFMDPNWPVSKNLSVLYMLCVLNMYLVRKFVEANG